MIDNEPAPLESREELFKEKEEKLSRAVEKKRKFQEELVAKQLHVGVNYMFSMITTMFCIVRMNTRWRASIFLQILIIR